MKVDETLETEPPRQEEDDLAIANPKAFPEKKLEEQDPPGNKSPTMFPSLTKEDTS